ncbi:MAG: FG-GAP-like repeat-containing protein, partial [Planktomarina sp.]
DGVGIVYAEYDDDLDIYPHRIMGRIFEKDTLHVNTHDGVRVSLTLSVSNPGHVFEDVKPHIGDLNGDGLNDVAVIETSLTHGASLAIYTVKRGMLVKIAQTPFVGRRNRWYAQLGFGDFNNDGALDVAFVDRPHLARIIRVYSIKDGRFQEIAAAEGVTNHAIGDEIIWGGVRRCSDRDEIVLKNQTSGNFMAIWINAKDNRFTGRDLGVRGGPAHFYQALQC